MAVRTSTTRTRGNHRVSPPSSALRGRVVVAAVAVGAFAAAAAGQTLNAANGEQQSDVTPIADSSSASAALGVGGPKSSSVSAAAPEILTVAKVSAAPLEAQKIAATDQIVQQRAARQAAIEAERNRPKFVRPAQGRLTSGYGARWGTTHYGLDIANRMGTPIVAAADGVVIEAGPANGFGLWVRIRHDDGMVSVYGHMDSFSVSEGDRVKAGEQIALMGSRGYSTGPHLHFEIWNSEGMRLNPMNWLNEHGVYF